MFVDVNSMGSSLICDGPPLTALVGSPLLANKCALYSDKFIPEVKRLPEGVAVSEEPFFHFVTGSPDGEIVLIRVIGCPVEAKFVVRSGIPENYFISNYSTTNI